MDDCCRAFPLDGCGQFFYTYLTSLFPFPAAGDAACSWRRFAVLIGVLGGR